MHRKVCERVHGIDKCLICESDENIRVHHVYGYNKEWRNHEKNLMPVCETCHRSIHKGTEGYGVWHRKYEDDQVTPFNDSELWCMEAIV